MHTKLYDAMSIFQLSKLKNCAPRFYLFRAEIRLNTFKNLCFEEHFAEEQIRCSTNLTAVIKHAHKKSKWIHGALTSEYPQYLQSVPLCTTNSELPDILTKYLPFNFRRRE